MYPLLLNSKNFYSLVFQRSYRLEVIRLLENESIDLLSSTIVSMCSSLPLFQYFSIHIAESVSKMY